MALSWQELMDAADQVGIKLEIVEGSGTWEAWPATRHQMVLQQVERSIRPSAGSSLCACHHFADIYIRFPDGSIKRPDISIFCSEVPLQDEALEMVPDAVVEIVSKGFEKKDLEIGPPFYLSQGVKNVVVVNPYDGKVHHHTSAGVRTFHSQQTIQLSSGCELTA
jgi:hypothetical protein